MKDENVTYEVKMHYSRETPDCLEYTEDGEEAEWIGVYTQIRDKKTGDLIDGDDETEFPNTEEGMKEAVEYAESLLREYGLEEEGYEFY